MSLHSIVYVSSSRRSLSAADIDRMVDAARQFNGAHGITGALLYSEGNFMQLLEGERAELESLMARIEKDARHGGVITLLSEAIPERAFEGWDLGYQNLRPVAAGEQPSLLAERPAWHSTAYRLMVSFTERARG